MDQQVETVIIGGGQAGLSISYYLQQQRHEHLVLEQAAQAANAWRNDRWDSFTLVTPNWTFRLPGGEYQGSSPDGFMGRAEIVSSFERYIERYHLPVQYQTRVISVEKQANGGGYRVDTGDKTWDARNVVIATGLFQTPKRPAFNAGISANINQLHSGHYCNPGALPPGAVMVVGSGQSGAQIAEELYQAGRKVYLCVGSAGRAPRRYRGKDIFEWLDLTGFMDKTVDTLSSPRGKFSANPHVSGRDGGHALNLHQFARDGVVLLGHLKGANGDTLWLDADLHENLAKVDKFEVDLVNLINGFIARSGIDAPAESLPNLRYGYSVEQITELNLTASGITSIIWAMGYRYDFSLVKLPVFDSDGYPIQKRGVTDYPGLFFLGLPWLYKQKSGLLIGVGEDAEWIADKITGKH